MLLAHSSGDNRSTGVVATVSKMPWEVIINRLAHLAYELACLLAFDFSLGWLKAFSSVFVSSIRYPLILSIFRCILDAMVVFLITGIAGGIKAVFWDYIFRWHSLCFSVSGPFLYYNFYKSLPVQSLEIMRYNIHATSSMAAPKAVSSVATFTRSPINSLQLNETRHCNHEAKQVSPQLL